MQHPVHMYKEKNAAHEDRPIYTVFKSRSSRAFCSESLPGSKSTTNALRDCGRRPRPVIPEPRCASVGSLDFDCDPDSDIEQPRRMTNKPERPFFNFHTSHLSPPLFRQKTGGCSWGTWWLRGGKTARYRTSYCWQQSSLVSP